MSSPSDQNSDDKAKAFFGYGNDAAQKGNDVYAAQMYKEACKLKPDNLVYRQSLRGVQRRKFGNAAFKVGRMVCRLKLQGLRDCKISLWASPARNGPRCSISARKSSPRAPGTSTPR